jgi:hypothetical protein
MRYSKKKVILTNSCLGHDDDAGVDMTDYRLFPKIRKEEQGVEKWAWRRVWTFTSCASILDNTTEGLYQDLWDS